jgi:hypothetical protein
MKNIVKVCGSIFKEESLSQIRSNVLKNTVVAEANNPYSDYYGRTNFQTTPNSFFLFTSQNYTLDEALHFSQFIDSCYMKDVNIATASLTMMQHRYYAIRVKHFPDYEHIQMLQNCCIKAGIEFDRKVHLAAMARVKVNKCFVLEEADKGIFIDAEEKHKGYIALPHPVSGTVFSEIMHFLKFNRKCKLFDAVQGTMIIDSQSVDIIRVYSENLDVSMLKCISENFLVHLNQYEYALIG